MNKRTKLNSHIPVLLNEIIIFLYPHYEKVYIDATFGNGGYSRSILEQEKNKKSKVIAFDCDQITINCAQKIKNKYQNNFVYFNNNYSNTNFCINNIKIKKIDVFLFDFGISSMQIGNFKRGFSFKNNNDCDMRNSNKRVNNSNIMIKNIKKNLLKNIFFSLGEEKKAEKFAKQITNKKYIHNIIKMSQIIKIISSYKYYSNIFFATKFLQAIRMFLNAEIINLSIILKKINYFLNNNGLIVTVTFNSVEDKIVKEFFKLLCYDKKFKLIVKKVLINSNKEIQLNMKARVSKIRILCKV